MTNERTFPSWNDLYASGQDVGGLPWYNEELDNDLRQELQQRHIMAGRFVDLGTGPATQAIRLAEIGFEVTGTDISQNAISRAKKIAGGMQLLS